MGMMVSVCNRVRGLHRKLHKGQTMTEYALILAAIAVVVLVTYEVMGQDIGSMVSKVNSSLTSS
jgi:Flp pilus assembly pilin Flp